METALEIISMEEENKNINAGLNRVLSDLGLTSVQGIHKITGIDKPTISRHMNNQQRLTVDHMMIYSKKLNTDISFFISDYIARYPVIGYSHDIEPEVVGKNEIDNHEMIFFLQRYKTEGSKFIWNKAVNHAMRFNENYHDGILGSKLLNSFCFIRTKRDIFEGLLGIVKRMDIKNKTVDLDPLWKPSQSTKYYKIYPIGTTYSIDFNDAEIRVLENGKIFLSNKSLLNIPQKSF